jgi:hypothetical protein
METIKSNCYCCGSFMNHHKSVGPYLLCEMCHATICRYRFEKLALAVLKMVTTLTEKDGMSLSQALSYADRLYEYDNDKKRKTASSHSRSIPKNKKRDLLDSWRILPGNFEGRG